MGKTPEAKRLRILVDKEYYFHSDINELKEKGHTVITWDTIPEYSFDLNDIDIVLSRKAHYWIPDMFQAGLLEIALKKARERKNDLA